MDPKQSLFMPEEVHEGKDALPTEEAVEQPVTEEAKQIDTMTSSTEDVVAVIKDEQTIPKFDENLESKINVTYCSDRPNLATLHPSFQSAELAVEEICSSLFKQICAAEHEDGYLNPEIEKIRDNINSLSDLKHRYPSVKAVACLGPSGAGKSSSLNSILAKSGLAIKDDGGDRGTNVTHEYSHALPDQTQKYVVQAKYYGTKAIYKLVEKHANIILRTYSSTVDEDAESNDEEEDEEQEEENDAKVDTAYEFFNIILKNFDDFKSIQSMKSFFEDAEVSIKEKIQTLRSNVDQFLSTRPVANRVETYTADTDGELIEVLHKVSKPRRDGRTRKTEASPWPLLSKVVIHYENDLLQTGLKLGDAPGVTDSNLSVVENALSYIKNADTILVFQPIDRIKSELTFDANLRECLKLHKHFKTIVVVTKVDQKDPMTESEKENLPDCHRDQVMDAEKALESIKEEERQVRACQIAEREGKAERFMKLTLRLEELSKEGKSAEAKLKQLAVMIRNDQIKLGLIDKFRKLERSKTAPDVKVLFISNVEYQKHLARKEGDPPFLDLEATGVPGLRRLLYGIPSRGKSDTLKRICLRLLPIQINSIINVLTKSRLERKDEVEKLIKTKMYEYSKYMKAFSRDLSALFSDFILVKMKSLEGQWTTRLQQLLDNRGARSWAKYNAMAFLAFCRRSGEWRINIKGQGRVPVSWNFEILEVIRDDLASAFDEAETEFDSVERCTETNLVELFDNLVSSLKSCEDFQVVDNETFFKAIRRNKEDVIDKIHKQFEDIRRWLKKIRYALTLEGDDNFIAKCMQPVYEECIKMSNTKYAAGENETKTGTKGRRSKKRKVAPKTASLTVQRVALIRAKFIGIDDQESLIANLTRLTRDELTSEIGYREQEYESAVVAGCDTCLQDFRHQFQVSDIKTEENPQAVERIKRAAEKALAGLHGPVKDHIRACEDFESSGKL